MNILFFVIVEKFFTTKRIIEKEFQSLKIVYIYQRFITSNLSAYKSLRLKKDHKKELVISIIFL